MTQPVSGKPLSEQFLVVVPDDDPPVMADSASVVRLRSATGIRVDVHTSRPTGESDLRSRIGRAHTVIFSRSAGHLTRPVLAACKALKHIVVMGAASESVDTEAAWQMGVEVTHTPDTISDAVAEHTLALMLALARRIPELDQRVRAGEWPRGLITQLSGKTLGVIGTSAAGRKLSRIAAGIGMNVVAWGPELAGRPGEHDDSHTVELEYLLRNSDVVSVHSRPSEARSPTFGPRQFAVMKTTAFLINGERAGLVDEQALTDALTSQTIAGAALDVFAREPIPKDSPLVMVPNVILSPHTAASTAEALSADQEAAVEIVLAYIAARRPQGVA